MREIPEDIRLLSELVARRHEERKFAIGGQTTEAIAADIADALMSERERCAKIAEANYGTTQHDRTIKISEAEAEARPQEAGRPARTERARVSIRHSP